MKKKTEDNSTEQKILLAARKVFTAKGYAATRTRDIAEEAGINLALLNYYFRSKDKLFEEVMREKITLLFGIVKPVLFDEDLSLEEKIEKAIALYIDMLAENPDLPIFVLSEIRTAPDRFSQIIPVHLIIRDSHLIRQIKERFPDKNPLQFLMSILGMTIFPFIMKPVFTSSGVASETQFKQMMMERKKLIPQWIKSIMKK